MDYGGLKLTNVPYWLLNTQLQVWLSHLDAHFASTGWHLQHVVNFTVRDRPGYSLIQFSITNMSRLLLDLS